MTTLLRVRDGFTYAGNTDLKVMTCPICGVTYAIPLLLQENAYKRGKGSIQWFCPNGHQLGYHGKSQAETEADRLRDEARFQRERAGRLAAARDQAEASARGYKGAATRARNRAKAGVCPCCNRTFQQLSRHMKSQHPDFEPGDI